MRVLVLGGTKFVGRHIVEAARSSGHEVVLFNRGVTDPDAFPDLEQVRGDRANDLGLLDHRTFDVVVDTSGYLPRVVESSVTALRDSTSTYVFVSSVSVYESSSGEGIDESSPVIDLGPRESEDVVNDYGGLKARCEEVVLRTFGDRALVVRSGLVVGPHDHTNRFTYWATRFQRGGTVLLPAPENRPVQFVDGRDLAAWTTSMYERGDGGTFNVVRPPMPFGDLVAALSDGAPSGARTEWVDSDFLLAQGVTPWTDLPLWIPDVERPLMAVSVERAIDAGLHWRPLEETIADTRAWAASLSELPGDAGLPPAREKALLELWASRSR